MSTAVPLLLRQGRQLASIHIMGMRAASTDLGKKTTQLKNLLNSPQLTFLMEAHSGLSARIVQETGFSGIWASGLGISAQLGVRDSNEASWTQVLEVVEFMADATNIPILLDADTGYGNFNNARRLIRKLEDRGVAGKASTLVHVIYHEVACKDHQRDPDFCVVARVEAFIAGWGLDEALERANAYREAGADAVLIHSKKADPSDIEAFMAKWNNKAPVVIVPTKYYSTPTSRFHELGIATVIWANHNLRASVTAMQETSRRILSDQSLLNVEKKVSI
uniref:Phosphoenolpyruvate phosphomutase n=1 Tax=Timema douglasi TaxID=61478 RepID=A0A7R8V9M0_TIMDO|nr:unnamed protein product [Timema douglasi]